MQEGPEIQEVRSVCGEKGHHQASMQMGKDKSMDKGRTRAGTMEGQEQGQGKDKEQGKGKVQEHAGGGVQGFTSTNPMHLAACAPSEESRRM